MVLYHKFSSSSKICEEPSMEKVRLTDFLSEVATIMAGICIFLVYIFIVFLLSPIFLYRWVLCKASGFLRPSLGKMVTARGQFLATEKFTCGNPSRAVIVVASIVRGHLSLEEARGLIFTRLVNAKGKGREGELKYPELQQYVTTFLGCHFWKPEANFDVCDHVVQYQPTSVFTDKQLECWIETLLNESFENQKSPWKTFVTNNYVNPNISSEEMTVICIKIHHCLTDGYGLLHAVAESLGNVTPQMPIARNPKRNHLDRVLSNLLFPFQSIYELSKFAVLTFQKHPWKIEDGRKSWRQIYSKTPIIPIEKVHSIKNKFEVSFTSVLVSAYAAATHKTLQRTKDEKVEKVLPCALILPLPDHPKILRNHCTGAHINVPTGNCTSVERLKECDREISRARKSVIPLYGRLFPIIGGSFTTGLAKHVGRNRQLPAGLSNFPVGAKKFELFNREMLHITIGAGAQVGVAGVNFFVYTYESGVQFTVTAENALMSHEDLRNMTRFIVDEIEYLHSMNIV